MSHLSCILCGLQRPVSSLGFEDNDLDIYLISKKGLGRGKGWEDQRESVLGDDVYTPTIKKRIMEIVNFFMSEEVITKNEISEITEVESEPWKNSLYLNPKQVQLIPVHELKKYEKELKELRESDYELREKIDKLKKAKKRTVEKHKHILKVNKNVNFALITIVKYFNTKLECVEFNEFKVRIHDLNENNMPILSMLHYVLSKKEWMKLMKVVLGADKETQTFLDIITKVKISSNLQLKTREVGMTQLPFINDMVDQRYLF